MIKLTTTLGEITLELDAAKAPLTVANFLEYVKSGHYDNYKENMYFTEIDERQFAVSACRHPAERARRRDRRD